MTSGMEGIEPMIVGVSVAAIDAATVPIRPMRNNVCFLVFQSLGLRKFPRVGLFTSIQHSNFSSIWIVSLVVAGPGQTFLRRSVCLPFNKPTPFQVWVFDPRFPSVIAVTTNSE
jgi:hypothetical protein